VKDGTKYLNEWLAYHYSIGVEHFYIINDMSADNIKEILEPWEKLGIVDVMNFKLNGRQREIYTYFIRKLANSTKWLGFLDLDEFLVVKEKKNALDWLNSFPEDTSAVEINWCCFGSSGLKNYENIFVTKRFTKYSSIDYKDNLHVKSIVKLGKNYFFLYNPHTIFPSASNVRNAKKELADRYFFQREVVWDNAWINHYYCLSREEFAEKIERWKANIHIYKIGWTDFESSDRNECTGDKSLENAEKQINDVLNALFSRTSS
jgi:hypothetical protein